MRSVGSGTPDWRVAGFQKFTGRVSGHNTALGRVRLHICFHSLLNQLIFDIHFSMRRPMDRDNS